MKYLSALPIMALLTGPLNAQEGIAVIGYQSVSCGTWTKDRREHSVALGAYEGWIEGFLSGLAFTKWPAQNPLVGIDTDAAFAWVDNYCSAHPLDTLSVATFALMKELSSRARNSN